MRVIAGTFRSRILKSLKGTALRPTSDYLRETLFNVLGPGISGSRFLDLYAGTGAVGIEALSRGAVEAVAARPYPRHLPLPQCDQLILILVAEPSPDRPAFCRLSGRPAKTSVFSRRPRSGKCPKT